MACIWAFKKMKHIFVWPQVPTSLRRSITIKQLVTLKGLPDPQTRFVNGVSEGSFDWEHPEEHIVSLSVDGALCHTHDSSENHVGAKASPTVVADDAKRERERNRVSAARSTRQ
jgi:hypothetical protein